MNKKLDKASVHRCKRCHKKIWVLESIIRGMGPICYGKSYSMRRMLKRGLTREEIKNIPKEELERLAKEELRRWKRKQRRLQGKRVNKTKKERITMKKIKSKKSREQTTLEDFLITDLESDFEIIDLKKQLYEITNSLSTTTGTSESDKALKLMDKIKELENKNV